MKKFMIIFVGLIASLFAFNTSLATIITFESLPSSNSENISRHGTFGPVLADDFMPSISGWVTQIDWWGSRSLTGQTDSWEITFHDDNGGEPAATLPEGGISQHFVSSGAVDPDNDGIYYYSALWNPQDLLLTAGTDYWFSVANASGAGWTWANGLVPTIGSEQYNAAVSTGVGPNGGPHFGPWDTVMTNFAFRIHVDPIPEPPMLALLGIAFAAMGLVFKVKECAS